MAEEDQDELLRETARHRGFRLVKSRRRKPGVGDYGKYGLTDAKTGKQCFGFGKRGLTATADDIAGYLRSSVAATWKRSAETTPERPKAPQPEPARPAAREPRKTKPPAARQNRSSARAVLAATPATKAPKLKPPPKPKPAPALKIRKAGRGDARTIAELVKQLGLDVATEEIATRLAALTRAKETPLVADRDGVIGCLAWHIVPTLHHGAIARITMIVVAENERRRGVGQALIEAAAQDMAQRGCGMIEAMSDIAIRNAHGFFRGLDFEQTSYRFARTIKPEDG